jgi:hypothetical protein
LVPGFDSFEGGAGAGVLGEDDIGFLGPHEGLRGGVVLGEIVVDGGLQLGNALEDAAPYAR